MWDRFTEKARKAIVAAQKKAMKYHNDTVDTEHLLLGLIEEKESWASRILAQQSVNLLDVQRNLERQGTGFFAGQQKGAGTRL